MKSEHSALVAALIMVLAAIGCAKAPTDAQSTASDSLEPPATEAARQPALAPTATTDETLSEATTPGGQFATNSLASPFANADLGLKELYDRALIAFQIGDYPRVLSELGDLANRPDLSLEQKRAVQELVAKTKKIAPDASANDLAGTKAGEQSPAVFPSAAPTSPNNVPEDPFSTADPAMKRSFARAKAAHDIGDYATARTELKELMGISQLNWQQKYAVQMLLDKTPQDAPAAATPPAGQDTKP